MCAREWYLMLHGETLAGAKHKEGICWSRLTAQCWMVDVQFAIFFTGRAGSCTGQSTVLWLQRHSLWRGELETFGWWWCILKSPTEISNFENDESMFAKPVTPHSPKMKMKRRQLMRWRWWMRSLSMTSSPTRRAVVVIAVRRWMCRCFAKNWVSWVEKFAG